MTPKTSPTHLKNTEKNPYTEISSFFLQLYNLQPSEQFARLATPE